MSLTKSVEIPKKVVKQSSSMPEMGDFTFENKKHAYETKHWMNKNKNDNTNKKKAPTVSSNEREKLEKQFRTYVGDQNYVKIIDCLDADPSLANSCAVITKNTPLHIAATNGDVNGIEILLEYKANIQAKNQKGETPHSILEKYIRIMKFQSTPVQPQAADENMVVGDWKFEELYESSDDDKNNQRKYVKELRKLKEVLKKLEVHEKILENGEVSELADKRTVSVFQ